MQRKTAQALHSGRPLKLCTAEDRPDGTQRKTAQTLHSGRPLRRYTAEDRSNSAQRKTAQTLHSGRPLKPCTAEGRSRHICFSNRLEHIRAEFLSQATCNARSPINQRMPPSAATSHISAHTSIHAEHLTVCSGCPAVLHFRCFVTCFGFGTCAARTFATTCFSTCVVPGTH